MTFLAISIICLFIAIACAMIGYISGESEEKSGCYVAAMCTFCLFMVFALIDASKPEYKDIILSKGNYYILTDGISSDTIYKSDCPKCDSIFLKHNQ